MSKTEAGGSDLLNFGEAVAAIKFPGDRALHAESFVFDRPLGQLSRGAETARQITITQIESFVQRIAGLGPEATLHRGYAIVPDESGRPLVTRREPEERTDLELEFQDGRLRVKNEVLARGAGR